MSPSQSVGANGHGRHTTNGSVAAYNSEQVIGHDLNLLDAAEAKLNSVAVREAKLKETTNLFKES